LGREYGLASRLIYSRNSQGVAGNTVNTTSSGAAPQLGVKHLLVTVSRRSQCHCQSH